MRSYAIVILILSLYSCDKKRDVDIQELASYVKSEEGGLFQERIMGDFKFTASIIPYELLVVKRFGNYVSKKEFEDAKGQTDSLIYIEFEISNTQSNKNPIRIENNKEKFYEKLYYLQSEVFKDFAINADGVSIPCMMANYEEDHNLLPVARILLAFNPVKVKKELILSYDDYLFGNGKIQFKYKASDINNTPILKLI